MATVNLHPSSTVENAWDLEGSADTGTAHGNLSDSSDNSVLREPDQNSYCIVELDDFTESADSITNIRWYVRATMFNTRNSSTNTAIQVSLGTGTHTSSSPSSYFDENVTVEFQAGYAQNDYYGTPRTQYSVGNDWNVLRLNALRLDVNTSPADPPGISKIMMAKCFVVVTYVATVTNNATFFGANF